MARCHWHMNQYQDGELVASLKAETKVLAERIALRVAADFHGATVMTDGTGPTIFVKGSVERNTLHAVAHDKGNMLRWCQFYRVESCRKPCPSRPTTPREETG